MSTDASTDGVTVTRACVARELDVDALVHYRPREGYIPIFARVARRPDEDETDENDDANAVFVVRLREDAEHVGAEGDLKRAARRDLADAFVVSTRVVAFGTTTGVSMTPPAFGRVRSIDTTKWPPEFIIETTDGETIRSWGRDACDAEAYEAETKRRRDASALADADAVANALLEEEERERERAARVAEAKRIKAKKKKRSTSDAARGDAEAAAEDDEAEALEREAKEKAAVEKAAAKAAARARQEEVKAAKAAKEKAAKKEAQKARKAAERAAREAREAEEKTTVGDASGDENEEPPAEGHPTTKRDEPVVEAEPSSATADESETKSIPDAETSMTSTQRRKLDKERRKAQRMAEIDAFLKAHEINAAQEEAESAGGARKRKNKKKKKPAAAAARLAPASARPFAQEWFATFAVIAFFTVLATAYSVVSFVAKKTTSVVA